MKQNNNTCGDQDKFKSTTIQTSTLCIDPMKNNASKPFNAAQNMRRLCHLEEINHPLAHPSRESAIGNNTSKQ